MFAVLLLGPEAAGKKNIHPFLLVDTTSTKSTQLSLPQLISEAKRALFRSTQTTPRWRNESSKRRREDRSITRKSLVAPKEGYDWDEHSAVSSIADYFVQVDPVPTCAIPTEKGSKERTGWWYECFPAKICVLQWPPTQSHRLIKCAKIEGGKKRSKSQ